MCRLFHSWIVRAKSQKHCRKCPGWEGSSNTAKGSLPYSPQINDSPVDSGNWHLISDGFALVSKYFNICVVWSKDKCRREKMAKTIVAIIALIMVTLSISSVSGQSVSYGTDQYGYKFTLYNYGSYVIYDYGLIRYIDYFGFGHWETWNGYTWQYYFPNSNNYGSNSYSNYYGSNSHSGRSSSSSGRDYYAEQLEKNNKIYAGLAKSQEHMNEDQRTGGWIPTGTLLPT
jgi:hypothetical protein